MLIIFYEKYTPLPRGYGGIFSEQQSLMASHNNKYLYYKMYCYIRLFIKIW